MWADKVGSVCTIGEAALLQNKFLCQYHFLPTASQLPVVAKWEHIEKLYKHDRDCMIRMLFKLKDTHMAPVTQCAMKVSLVAQVISHTVAAGNLHSGVLW